MTSLQIEFKHLEEIVVSVKRGIMHFIATIVYADCTCKFLKG